MNNKDMFMSCKEFADLLRKKVDTIYSWIHYKQLPEKVYRKIGNTPLFIKDEVIKWILEDGAVLKRRNWSKEVKNLQTNSDEIKDITKEQQNCSMVNELHWTKIQQKEGG